MNEISKYAFCALILLVGVLLFNSCRTVRETAEKVVYRDSIQLRTEVLRDSIYFRDTTRIKEQGDTIYIEQIKWRYKEKFVAKTDTVVKTDYQTITNEKVITKKVIPWWCWVLLLAFAVCVIYTIRSKMFGK